MVFKTYSLLRGIAVHWNFTLATLKERWSLALSIYDGWLFCKYYPPPHGATAPSGPGPPHYGGFTITLRHTTLGRTPLEEWSAGRRDLYLTTHNTQKRQTSMPLAGFELAIPEIERPQIHALFRAATGIGRKYLRLHRKFRGTNSVNSRYAISEPLSFVN
jgi:hypothetical protein